MRSSVAVLAAAAALLLAPVALAQEGEREPPRVGNADELTAKLNRLVDALRVKKGQIVGETLLSFRASEDALNATLTEEGQKALAPKILEATKALFADNPGETAKRLRLNADLTDVTVFSATTEDLVSMEFGTTAAREFASGLKKTARFFKPRQTFYCALMQPAGETAEDPEHEGPVPVREGAIRLQLFVFHDGSYVYLGRVWRLDAPE